MLFRPSRVEPGRRPSTIARNEPGLAQPSTRTRRRDEAPVRPPPARRRRRRRRLNPWLRLVLLSVGALLLIVGVGAALAIDDGGGDAPDQVSVAGVDVSGLSPARGRAGGALPRAAAHGAAGRDRRGPTIRAPASGPRAPRSGPGRGCSGPCRRPSSRAPTAGGCSRAWAWPARGTCPSRSRLDPRRVEALVGRVSSAGRQARRPVPAPPRRDDDITVVTGRGGLRRRSRRPAPPHRAAPPGRHPGVAWGRSPRRSPRRPPQEARELALRVVAAPVEVTFQGRGVAIEPEVLRSALRFQRRPAAPARRPWTRTCSTRTSRPPSRRASSRRATPPSACPAAACAWCPRASAAASTWRPSPPTIVAHPGTPVRARALRGEPPGADHGRGASALRITELVSEFTTPYNCCEPRVTNIQRAAEILDGTIIPAGGTFSLNDALGQRTLDRGFVLAPQIAAGRLEDAVGGGVSQVSTTIYNAAFFAGLELVAHTPHQFWISRYPEGREATLSFGGPELIFVNDWDAAILDLGAARARTASRSASSPRSSGAGSRPRPASRRDIVEPQRARDGQPRPGAGRARGEAGARRRGLHRELHAQGLGRRQAQARRELHLDVRARRTRSSRSARSSEAGPRTPARTTPGRAATRAGHAPRHPHARPEPEPPPSPAARPAPAGLGRRRRTPRARPPVSSGRLLGQEVAAGQRRGRARRRRAARQVASTS